MLVVGLTGSLATGKSTVASIFGALGAKVVDADVIVRKELTADGKCFHDIVKAFGDDILDAGRISRQRLAEIVFKDQKKLKKLEDILHPVVCKQIQQQLKKFKAQAKVKIVIVDVPLLFESGLDRGMDITLVVKATQKEQLERAAGFGMTKAEALRRIRSQMPINDKIRLADMIIDNKGNLIQTKRQVNEIWQKLIQKKRN